MKKHKTTFVLMLLSALIIPIAILNVAAQETPFWGADVPSTGESILTPTLEGGREYHIAVYGVFYYDFPKNLVADAQYYTTDPSDYSNWGNVFPAPDGHSFLQINAVDVYWGTYSPGHSYDIHILGTEAPISFRIFDWVDQDYSNNICHLRVEINELPRYYGLTPGFWKNHPDAWPTDYSTNDQLRSIFGTCAPRVTLMNALSSKGGPNIAGAKNILARAAAAALLNAAAFGSSYPNSEEQLIEMVSYQFCHGDRDSILSLATNLDYWNNMGSPPNWP
jgi:hypothetical protein